MSRSQCKITCLLLGFALLSACDPGMPAPTVTASNPQDEARGDHATSEQERDDAERSAPARDDPTPDHAVSEDAEEDPRAPQSDDSPEDPSAQPPAASPDEGEPQTPDESVPQDPPPPDEGDAPPPEGEGGPAPEDDASPSEDDGPEIEEGAQEPDDEHAEIEDEEPEPDDEGVARALCDPNPCLEPGRGTCVEHDDGTPRCECDPGHVESGGVCTAHTLLIRFIDVGHGDAIHLQLGDYDILVDAGKPTRHAEERLDQALAGLRGELDLLVITHPHNDHVGGAAHVLESVEVAEVITNGESRDIRAHVAFEAQLLQQGLNLSRYTAGDVIEPLPGLVLEVLAAGGLFPDTERGEDINNDSVVLRVSWANRRVMLTGDIEEDAGERLVQSHCPPGQWQSCPSLQADILKVPHHGSAHQSLEFLRAVAPSQAVISAGFEDRRYHLPRLSIVRHLRDELGATVSSTSAPGDHDVVLTIDADGSVEGAVETSVYGWERDEQGEWQGSLIHGAPMPGA